MGVELISVGSVAPWYTKVSPPVARGLEGWFCFDTALDRIAFNRAPGKGNGAIVGAPTVGTNYARFTGNASYLQTDIKETAEFTVMLISKAVSVPDGSPATTGATTPMHFGTFTGPASLSGYPTSYGISMFNQYPNRTSSGVCRDDGTGSGVTSAQAFLTETINTWALRVLRGSDTLVSQYKNLTSGITGSSSTATKRVPTTNTIRVGSGYGSFAGQVDVSQIIIFSSYLTDDEVSKVAALMRTRASRLGITV
ncbi:hypothetical protein [Pantoea sp. A4]|uniref:hypothetical protein n=1 Tax=Pantoea sp. A4 TaxID=1225184 RepID=UPI00037C99CD|nr:hypothetical protein [Pantoea sp. A4]